jgi:hypothetical protein
VTTDQPTDAPGLTYLRSVYADVFEWYKIADVKSQLILTLDGALITVATGLILASPDQLAVQERRFGWETWMFFTISSLALTMSVVCAVKCLYSRLDNASQQALRKHKVDPENGATYVPAIAYWFGTIAKLDPQRAVNYLKTASRTSEFEIEALASEIVAFSRNVLDKHRWANRAWLLTSVSLIALFAMGASYLVRARLAVSLDLILPLQATWAT